MAARVISEVSPPSYSYIHTLLMNVRSAVLGYNPIITIPAGATNINVTEIRRSKNYLGKLCGLNNTFYLSLPSSFITKSLTRMKWAQASFSYCRVQCLYIFVAKQEKKKMTLEVIRLENPGIDPGTSRMLSGRSTIWANSPVDVLTWLLFSLMNCTEQHFVTEVESNAVSGYASSLTNNPCRNEIGRLARILGGINRRPRYDKIIWVFIFPTLLTYKCIS